LNPVFKFKKLLGGEGKTNRLTGKGLLLKVSGYFAPEPAICKDLGRLPPQMKAPAQKRTPACRGLFDKQE
jgi:hypothetical protein